MHCFIIECCYFIIQRSLFTSRLQWWNVGISPANFPSLSYACSRPMTSYVGKPSAACQPTRPTQPFILSGSITEYQSYYDMSSTSLWWRHMVNACEVKAHLIGLLAKAWRRLFWAVYTLRAKPGCCCCPVWQCVVSLLPCAADCCMLYTVCKVERFVLTIIKTRCSAIAERPRCRVRYSFRQK